jgi:glycosyltransferase domain-containing protein
MLNEITIIIPTYNRKKFILRSLEYWSLKGLKVLILDGSKDYNFEAHNYENSNINYIHSPIGFWMRLKSAKLLIKTKYCAMVGDDEFFLIGALESAIKELNIAPEVVACYGNVLGFDVNKNSIPICKEVYPEFKAFEVNGDSSAIRMNYHMKYYSPMAMYSVMRAEVWSRIIEIISLKEIEVYAIHEIQLELLAAYYGKLKHINQYMWIRSYENETIFNTDLSLTRNKLFPDWYKNKNKSIEIDEFLDGMVIILNENENENENKSELRYAFDNYIDFTMQLKKKRFSISNIITYIEKKLRKILNISIPSQTGILIKNKYSRSKPMRLFVNNENNSELLELEKFLTKWYQINNV